ncbi:carbon-nitrogen hydrolase [Ketobacter sp. MCCC 1A13808]|uniref:carbon-nitrogen hydrolase n=1 Tax=Ketobacter sp. MCCC 1A13808 TaxID=2602738 RepID=UPI0012EC429A|nr:carbon-nitrogen hydrolase [Ketobacter sp. MCCC 1A13808]MVF10710.1 carbon-nitrogen hydrolase [Ketobacter sp. MCCC 1A13808]
MSENTHIRVAVIQQPAWPDKDKSLAQTEQLLQEVMASAKPDLVLLQELHCTHYFCQTEDTRLFDLAEPLDGPSAQQLAGWAAQYQVVIVGSLFEKRAPGVFHNTAVVFDKDGSLAGFYRKMHIPDDPGFYEKFYFTPGDATQLNGNNGFTPIQTSIGKLGVLVCWDQWYPEAARLMALAGADLLLYPTAIGWDPGDTEEEKSRQKEAWQLIQRSHSIANHLPVLVANRVGHESDPSKQSEGIQFWGNSFIAGPQGELLAQADAISAQSLYADIDIHRTEYLRRIWPYFRDRRIDAYDGLTKRFLRP